jgi:hypothetical protein
MFGKTLIILFSLILSGFLVNGLGSQQFVTDGLVGFWSLDRDTIESNNVADLWGDNDGTIFGDPEIVQGKINEALKFDGQGDYIQLPDMGEEMAVTVEAWVNCSLIGGNQGIVSSFPADQWNGHKGTVHFKFSDWGVYVIWATTPELWDVRGVGALSGAVLKDTWYHAVYTSDVADEELKLYIDGNFVSKVSGISTANNLTHIHIACEHNDRFLHGMIDEVRIYKRVLSADEVSRNFETTSNVIAEERAVRPKGNLAITWGSVKCCP